MMSLKLPNLSGRGQKHIQRSPIIVGVCGGTITVHLATNSSLRWLAARPSRDRADSGNDVSMDLFLSNLHEE